jgi:DNA adenine methylase
VTAAPKITAIAPWFGAKRNMAPRIAAELGPHNGYWEPFCGSMAMLFAKEECRSETVNDLHGDLINLARVIQHPTQGAALYRRLRRTWFCQELHRECQESLKTATEPVDRAFLYFVKSWQGMSGISGRKRAESKLCIRYTNTGGDPAVRFSRAVESIPAWRRRMRGVRILNEDAFKMLSKIEDAADCVVYADPPYYRKSSAYLHDFKVEQHAELATLLGRFKKTRVVVSYYCEPEIRELYRGWTFVDCATRKALAHQGMRDMKGTIEAPEILIINGPSYTAPLPDDLFGDEG